MEGCKHQNDSDVHHQSFPEMVPEDQGIYSDDEGYHRHHVRHGNHPSCHCDLHRILRFEHLSFRSPARIRHVPIWLRQGAPRVFVNYILWARTCFSVRVVRTRNAITTYFNPSWKGCFCCRLKWSGGKTSGTRNPSATLASRVLHSAWTRQTISQVELRDTFAFESHSVRHRMSPDLYLGGST